MAIRNLTDSELMLCGFSVKGLGFLGLGLRIKGLGLLGFECRVGIYRGCLGVVQFRA